MGAGIDPQRRGLGNVPLERDGPWLSADRVQAEARYFFFLPSIPGHHVYKEKVRIKHKMCVSLVSRALPWSTPQPRVFSAMCETGSATALAPKPAWGGLRI